MITRQTKRADGQTVGEAMNKDAAFLRSIGIAAKDGMLTYDEHREQFVQRVRDSVLLALDSCVTDGKGWHDQDLPKLFKVVDAHAKRLFDQRAGRI